MREPEPLDTGRQQLDGHCRAVLPWSGRGRRPSELALVAFVCVSRAWPLWPHRARNRTEADSRPNDRGPARLKEHPRASRGRAGEARTLKETDHRKIKCGL